MTDTQKNLDQQTMAWNWGIWGAGFFCGTSVLVIIQLIFGQSIFTDILTLIVAIPSFVVNLIAAIKYNELNSFFCVLFGFLAIWLLGLAIFLIIYMQKNKPQQNIQNTRPENRNNRDDYDYKNKSPHKKDEKPKPQK